MTDPTRRRRRLRLPRARVLFTSLGALSVVGAGLALPLGLTPPQPQYTDVPMVTVSQDEVSVVCPGAPQLPDAEAGAEVTYDLELDTGAEVMETQTQIVSLPPHSPEAEFGQVGEELQSAQAVSQLKDTGPSPITAHYPVSSEQLPQVVGSTYGVMEQGDLRGMVAGTCFTPSSTTWLVGGETEVGSSTQLVLTNPAETPARVRVQGWSGVGPIGSEVVELVEPGTTKVVLTETMERTDRLAYHITTEGGQVGAYLVTFSLDGIVPQGVSYVTPGAQPALDTFVGPLHLDEYDQDYQAHLRIANPGDEASEVAVTLFGPEGAQELGGTDGLTVEAGAVSDIPLATGQAGDYTLHINTTQPVVAGAYMTMEGSHDSDLGGTPSDISWLPSAQPASELLLPTPEDSRALVANPSADEVSLKVEYIQNNGETTPGEELVIPGMTTVEIDPEQETLGIKVTGGVVVGATHVTQDDLLASLSAISAEHEEASIGVVGQN